MEAFSCFLRKEQSMGIKEFTENIAEKIVDLCKKKLLLLCEFKIIISEEEYVRVIHKYSAVKVTSEN